MQDCKIPDMDITPMKKQKLLSYSLTDYHRGVITWSIDQTIDPAF
jgi:hypothetical protein